MQMYDISIRNGTLIDTRQKKLTAANLYLKDGRIAHISREDEPAAEIIDATGRYVSPGFIDIHAHIEGNRANGALLSLQGVTTVLNGNCGMSAEDIGGFIDAQNKQGFVLNQLELCGATLLRMRAGQNDPYAPLDPGQLCKANILLEEALEQGAAGLSFGLEYVPGSSREEVLTLSRTAARYGKLVTIHIRTDCYEGLLALREAIDINRITGAAVQISHVVYQFGFGMMREALEMIDKAVRDGCDISCDSGMYTSFATYIGTPVFEPTSFEKWGCSYDSLFAANGKYAGQYLNKQKYDDLRCNHPNDVAIALIGKPYEIPMAFELPYMMTSSDAGVNQTEDTSKGHPQDAGTFPRFISELVRKRA
ncbi:MAG: amidohydrolase family protein, partial [Acetanaerobacterium sp.]